MKKKTFLFLCMGLILLSGSAYAQVFDINLNGAQQVPANDSTAVGKCLAYLNEGQTELTVICSHDVADVTVAHIHRGAADEIGPPILPFDSPASPMKGNFSVTAGDVSDLFAGLLYVNVHSDAYPGGEIRGQIGPPSDSGVYLELDGSQAVPPVTTDASGACMTSLNPLNTVFDIACTNDVENITAAHIHRGAAGENGPPVFTLAASTTMISEVTAADLGGAAEFQGFLDDLWWGNLYVNVHSTAHPDGEIRGQIGRPALSLYFPQFGNGGGTAETEGFTSSIVLVNTSTTTAVSGTVYFRDMDGYPLPVGLTGGSGVIPPGTPVSQVDFSLEPLGSTTVNTDGNGDILLGSAEAISDQPISGIIRFSIPGIGIAGFGSAPPMTRAIVPVRNEDGIRTALAIRNNETNPIAVSLSLHGEDGSTPGNVGPTSTTAEIWIPANGRVASFIDEYFSESDLTGFVGTLMVTTSDGGSFSAIALELDQTQPGIFTSLPVSSVTGP